MTRKVTSGAAGGTDAVTGEFPSIRRAEAHRAGSDDVHAAVAGDACAAAESYPSYAPITITASRPLVDVDALGGSPADKDNPAVDPAVGSRADSRAAQGARRHPATGVAARERKARPEPTAQSAQSQFDSDDLGGTPLVVLLWIAIAGIVGAMAIWWFLPVAPASVRARMPQWYERAVQNSDWQAEAAEYIPLVVGATIVVLLLAALLRRRILVAVCVACIVAELACGIAYFVVSGTNPQDTAVNLRDGEGSVEAAPSGYVAALASLQ